MWFKDQAPEKDETGVWVDENRWAGREGKNERKRQQRKGTKKEVRK